MSTTPAEQSARALPEGRYGKPRGGGTPRRLRAVVLAVAAVALGGVLAFVAYQNLGAAPIEAQRRSFAEVGPDSMEITLDVTRDDPARPGVCIVRVRDLSGAESGRREVLVPASVPAVSAVIRSSGKPVTADVFGCSYDVPDYLSSE
ncbi:DUF4307 domain-containing protein [Amycolatopsis antarctica]|uniref:DUF4307 domain-containing protein n=1 Tax=Amycolatopsis antarctica TaxID=1854586 RepID=UPI001F0A7BDD|nr:DUF4307 domain-containing protein [Amycolatopsis antarctica]